MASKNGNAAADQARGAPGFDLLGSTVTGVNIRNRTKNQANAVSALGAELDRVMQSDRLYFERFPTRKHRVRLASHVEIAEMETVAGRDCGAPAGAQIYVAVKNIAPGLRIRTYLSAPADCDTDLTEAQAAEIFYSCAGEMHRKLEAKMREAADRRVCR
jgi:hypothetical protein